MNVFWAFLIVVTVFFFLFVIIPSLFQTPVSSTASSYQVPVVLSPQEVARQRATEEQRQSKMMLDGYYVPAKDVVPEDYPRKIMGECPYSKPPSTDLPIANVPLCMAVRPQNMKLA
jgi:hypothetical protein